MPIRFPDIRRSALDAKADRTPTAVGAGETLVVPAETQMLFSQSIAIEGDGVIQIDGSLIEVD